MDQRVVNALDDGQSTSAARRFDDAGNGSMTQSAPHTSTLPPLAVLDDETAALIDLAAMLTGGSEADVREALSAVLPVVRPSWVEELILQTYLFAGFPRALNAAREWRRLSGRSAPTLDDAAIDAPDDRLAQGERTCAIVYGRFYTQLRTNIQALHPALDQWMIEEGYGKVLSRAPLDLARRELCIVAACAIARQERQLHSHLHGALHAGVAPDVISAALARVTKHLADDDRRRAEGLWARVQGK